MGALKSTTRSADNTAKYVAAGGEQLVTSRESRSKVGPRSRPQPLAAAALSGDRHHKQWCHGPHTSDSARTRHNNNVHTSNNKSNGGSSSNNNNRNSPRHKRG